MTAATPITPRTLALSDRGFDDHGDAVIVLPTEAIQIPPLLARCYLGLGWRRAAGARAPRPRRLGAVPRRAGRARRRGELRAAAQPLGGDGRLDRALGRRALRPARAARGLGRARADADLERIYFQLPKLDDAVCAVSLVINVFTSGRTFGDVRAAHCHAVNADTEQEIGRFSLRELGACEALVFARFVRQPDGRWDWLALGQPARGRVARETAAADSDRAAASGGDGRGRARRRHAADARARAAPALIAASAAGVAAAALTLRRPRSNSTC